MPRAKPGVKPLAPKARGGGVGGTRVTGGRGTRGVGSHGEAEKISKSESKSEESETKKSKSESKKVSVTDIVKAVKENIEAATTPIRESSRSPADLMLRTPIVDIDMAWFLFYVEGGARPVDASSKLHCSWAQMRSYINQHDYFRKKYIEAFESGLDCLEDEIRRRGFDGFESREETTHEVLDKDGVAVELTSVKVKLNYDSALALAYLKRMRKEWRDHSVQDVNATVRTTNMTDAELDSEIDKRLKELEKANG